jgi:hypothetical protein
LRTVGTIHLYYLLTVRAEQRHNHINAALVDDYTYVLSGGEGNSVGLGLSPGEFAIERLIHLQKMNIVIALLSESGCEQ